MLQALFTPPEQFGELAKRPPDRTRQEQIGNCGLRTLCLYPVCQAPKSPESLRYCEYLISAFEPPRLVTQDH
jgi:hypothetical protein